MNPLSLIAVIGAAGLAAAASAQTPPSAVVPVAPHYGQGEPLGNYETGVIVDRYIGDPAIAPTRIAHEALFTQRIFGPGDFRTGSAGAVLPPGQVTDVATLRPGDATPLMASAQQTIFYVDQGRGRLDDGTRVWDLYSGIAVAVPANVAYRLTNTEANPLKMVRFSFTPRPESPRLTAIQVRDSHKLGMSAKGVLWNVNAKTLFGPEVGVERMMLVSLGPLTLTGPSALPPQADPADGSEQWIRVSSEDSPGNTADMVLQLGSEVREWPVHAGYVAPADGQVVHGQYNVGDTIEDALVIIGPRRGMTVTDGPPGVWPAPPQKGQAPSATTVRSWRESLVPGRPLASR